MELGDISHRLLVWVRFAAVVLQHFTLVSIADISQVLLGNLKLKLRIVQLLYTRLKLAQSLRGSLNPWWPRDARRTCTVRRHRTHNLRPLRRIGLLICLNTCWGSG
jgi:hypothetical protein